MRRLEEELGANSRICIWVRKSVKENCKNLRIKMKKEFKKKFEFLKGKYQLKYDHLDELS